YRQPAWLHPERGHDVAHDIEQARGRRPAREGREHGVSVWRTDGRHRRARRKEAVDGGDGRCCIERARKGHRPGEGARVMTHITRRSALTVVAGGMMMTGGRWARAADNSGRVIYPVAVPVYQTQFVADRMGFFKEAGLDCKLIQGGSGVKTREIIAS